MRTLVALVLVVPVVLLGVAWADRSANERRLAEAAGQIAGRPVEIDCQSRAGELLSISPNAGEVQFDAEGRPGDTAHLNRETCTVLERFAEEETGPPDFQRVARALHVLAHEAAHLAGIRDEAATDCYGSQHVEDVALGLGAEPAEAQALAATALAERLAVAPAEYRSFECRPGGALDLEPATPAWP